MSWPSRSTNSVESSRCAGLSQIRPSTSRAVGGGGGSPRPCPNVSTVRLPAAAAGSVSRDEPSGYQSALDRGIRQVDPGDPALSDKENINEREPRGARNGDAA
jgi:hypothetical protein